jgi:leader peptidase (prepilin peptidase)/N-methyltransferase
LLFAANLLEQLPPWYLYAIVFVYGAFVGSFLNVCIIRIPLEGMSVFSPARSICFGCNQQIAWYDNIPILSFLWLRGRCRCQKYSISLQYPLVELMTAVMAVAVVRRFGPRWESLVIFAFVCVLIVITFIDLAYWIIPDVLSLPTIPLAIAAAAWFGPPLLPTWQDAAFGAALGGGSLLFIHLFYEWVLRRTGLGLGDVKFLALIGAFVGWKNTLTVVFLASVQGVIVTIFLYLLGWREQVPEDWEEEAFETSETSNTSEASVVSETSNTSEASEASNTSEASEASNTSNASTSNTSETSSTSNTSETSSTSNTSATSETSNTSETSESSISIGDPEEANNIKESNDAEISDASKEVEKDIGLGRVAIPFGPFLALGAFEVIFWGERIVAWWMETMRRIFLPY